MDMSKVEPWAMRHHGIVVASIMRRPGEDDPRRLPMPSVRSFQRAMKSGALVEIHPGVARLRGAPETREQRIAAAALAVPGSLASHRSSAHLWGVERPDDDPVDLLAERSRSSVSLVGVELHRPRDRDDLARSIRSGIPCTNPIRMLLDLGAVDPAGVPRALEHVVVSGRATPRVLRELVVRHSTRGRQGVVALREALADWSLGEKPADSVLEPAMMRLLEQHGLPPAEFHPRIGRYEPDFRIIGTPLLLECDGWESHAKSRETWQCDRERDADLLAMGHPTIRFTWHHITRRAAYTAEQIRRNLATWAPELWAAWTSSGGSGRGIGRLST